MTSRDGFSLIEILVVMAVFGILVAAALPLAGPFYRRNTTDVAAQTVAAALRRAQALAMSGQMDADWSATVASTTVTVALSSQNYKAGFRDEVTMLPEPVRASGTLQYVFSELAGTTTPGTLTLVGSSGATRTISVSSYGTVSY